MQSLSSLLEYIEGVKRLTRHVIVRINHSTTQIAI